MDSMIIVYMTIFVALAFVLMTFAVFAIGFLIGYKNEDKKFQRNKQNIEIKETQESETEKKAKKEWKNFLKYDGSSPQNCE